MRASIVLLLALLAGCASPRRCAEAEARAYERGYAQAVKEQYWILQSQQRASSPRTPPSQP